jgi:hypothetical protein
MGGRPVYSSCILPVCLPDSPLTCDFITPGWWRRGAVPHLFVAHHGHQWNRVSRMAPSALLRGSNRSNCVPFISDPA